MKLLTQSEVVRVIGEIKTIGGALQASIHLAACSTLEHVQMHGDTTGAVALMNALPNGQRVKSLAFWFNKFSGKKLTLNMDKASGLYVAQLSKQRQKDGSDFDIEGACAVTFADLTTERDPISVTVESMVRNIKRNATNVEVHDNGNPKVEPAARELASKIYAYLIETGDVKAAA